MLEYVSIIASNVPGLKTSFTKLLHKYVKNYCQPLNPSQIRTSVEGYYVIFTDVVVKTQRINELLSKNNIPFDCVECSLKELRLSTELKVELHGLNIIGQIKYQYMHTFTEADVKNLTKQLNEELENPNSQLHLFNIGKEIIDSYISDISVSLKNVHIQLEHCPQNAKNGIAVHMLVKEVNFKSVDNKLNKQRHQETELPSGDVASVEKIAIQGISLYTSEFIINKDLGTKDANVQQDTINSRIETSDPIEYDTEDTDPMRRIEFLRFYGEQNVFRYVYDQSKSGGEILSDKQNATSGSASAESEDDTKVTPLVHIHANLKSFAIFLTPRQVHLLLDFSKAVLESITKSGETIKQKSITESEIEMVKNEMANQSQLPVSNLFGMDSWSGPKSGGSVFSDSRKCSLTDSMLSNVSYYTTSEDIDDKSDEAVQLHLEADQMVAILFHEEFLRCSHSKEEVLLQSTILELQNMSEKFFNEIESKITNKDCDIKDSKLYLNICKGDHLRLTMRSFTYQNDKENFLKKIFSVANFELSECLNYARQDEPTIDFALIRCSELHELNALTVVCDKFKDICNHRVIVNTLLDIRFDLPLFIEFDITTVERLSALLNPWSSALHEKFVHSENMNNTWISVPTNPLDYETDLHIKICNVDCKLRFPIPDFRSRVSERNPPWKRNLRPDFLVLKFEDVKGYTRLSSTNPKREYILKWCICKVNYTEKEGIDNILLGEINKNEETLPEIRVYVYPEMEIFQNMSSPKMAASMTQSFIGYSDSTKEIHGPFSVEKVVYQSNILHEALPNALPKLVLPGNKTEMNNFIQDTFESSRIGIKCNIPILSAQLISKHFYEVLYNRIMNDLLLWKPYSSIMKGSFGSQYGDIDSSSSEEGDLNEQFSNFYVHKHNVPLPKNELPETESETSAISIDFKIDNFLLSMIVPARDSSTKVIPNNFGEFLFKLKNVQIFSVTSYLGNENLDFISIQALEGQMYHCDVTSNVKHNRFLINVNDPVPNHLTSTLYKMKSEGSVYFKDRTKGRDMISVAIRINCDRDVSHTKAVTVSLGLSKAILNYKMYQGSNHWVSQLIDFFSVLDQPIAGYESRSVSSQLHFHVWNSIIDYRPLFLPWNAILHVGYFTFTSQVSETSGANISRFLAEDFSLHMGKKENETTKVTFKSPTVENFNLRKDYVQLAHERTLEISLRTLDKFSKKEPCYDFRISNDLAHITVTVDSLQALTELVKYLVNYGDLPEYQNSMENSSVYKENDVKLFENPDEAEKLKQVHEYVNTMLEEAINEEISVKSVESETPESFGAKLFYFKDEKRNSDSDKNVVLPQVVADLGTPWPNDTDTDDEYCVIGLDDNELAHFPKTSNPEIIWLTDKPLVIKHDFFVPTKEPENIFKAPPDTPIPYKKYTASNMNLLISIYGGDDFKPVKMDKQLVKFDGNASHKTESPTVAPNKKDERKEMNIGGPNRDYTKLVDFSFTKVKYLLEMYPKNENLSSRHVLGIQEFEIIDFLECSHINKLLYRWLKESVRPLIDSPMILVKNTYLQPDVRLNTKECSLSINVAPIRMNVDQYTLNFLIEFISDMINTKEDEIGSNTSSRHSTPTHVMPVISVNMEKVDQHYEDKKTTDSSKTVEENLLIVFGDDVSQKTEDETLSEASSIKCDNPDTFIRLLQIPMIEIMLDYDAEKMDFSKGSSGILAGLTSLSNVRFKLARITCRRGLRGFHKALEYCVKVWCHDVKYNQYNKVLGGLNVIDCLLKIVTGLRDLIMMPIQQYKKDGRIIRGLQRGANSFTASAALAFLELALRLIAAIQVTAEHAYIMISPNPNVCLRLRQKSYKRLAFGQQPNDIREGVFNAMNVVQDGFSETAQNFMQITYQEHEEKGYTGAVGGVIRQIPAIVVDPIIIATEATSNVLSGIQSQLQPKLRNETKQKYREKESR